MNPSCTANKLAKSFKRNPSLLIGFIGKSSNGSAPTGA